MRSHASIISEGAGTETKHTLFGSSASSLSTSKLAMTAGSRVKLMARYGKPGPPG